jgi:hypothetical protein
LRLLEAVLDERLVDALAGADAMLRAELETSGLLEPAAHRQAIHLVRDRARRRTAEWSLRSVTQGEVLDAFARHCRDDLDDVEVLAHDDSVLLARWRSETTRIEARLGTVGIAKLAGGPPTMLLADLESSGPDLLDRYLSDAGLRGSVAVVDLARLERLGAVRSSVLVYFDWFLREEYGVKVLPANAFTQGLLARGIISLGMG